MDIDTYHVYVSPADRRVSAAQSAKVPFDRRGSTPCKTEAIYTYTYIYIYVYTIYVNWSYIQM